MHRCFGEGPACRRNIVALVAHLHCPSVVRCCSVYYLCLLILNLSARNIYIYTLIRQSVQRKVSRCLILAHDVGWLCEAFSAAPVVVSPKNDQNMFQLVLFLFYFKVLGLMRQACTSRPELCGMGCSVRRRIAHSFHLVSPCTVYTLSVSTFWSLGVLPMFVDFDSISKSHIAIYIYTLIRQSVQRKVSLCLILAHDAGWLCEAFSAAQLFLRRASFH